MTSNELFPIEREILEKLKEATQRLKDEGSARKWTTAFKETLKELGEGRGLAVWGSFSDDPDNSEWLWDITWADCPKDSEGRYSWRGLRQVVLACEIEWKPDGDWLLEDFLKLTVCNAAYRVFVFTQVPNNLEKWFDMLMDACPGSRGYRYLAIAVPNTVGGKVEYRAWTL
ncbi:MAG: hypothetical protein KAY37_06905 [Phycisphaerae bacterium]|nr:hypothetical protein [Phycisphaerae bacterium]